MKLLLTSAGIMNASTRDELVDQLGKPISDAHALVVPIVAFAFEGGAAAAWQFINGTAVSPPCELSWRSLGVLELTASPRIDRGTSVPALQRTDALLVGERDPRYPSHWMRRCGRLGNDDRPASE